jgi:hypothetical protein
VEEYQLILVSSLNLWYSIQLEKYQVLAAIFVAALGLTACQCLYGPIGRSLTGP